MSLKDKKYIKDTFCIAPWTEMHFGVQKEVLPCCKYNYQHSFGNLNQTDDLKEIYNSEKAKYIRSSLFTGHKPKECSSCWKDEELSKNQSYREFHNEYYGDYIEEALENTNDDFSLKEIKLRRLDIRFDNKCNLKCRICNSDYSTSWYVDDVKLGRKPEKKTNVYQQSISSKVFDFIIEQLKNVDEIFFAGGEPLMQDGHYLILEKAIELGYNDKIRLTYNTNFSSLKYKKKDIISLWKKFQFVNIGASLDASHKQGEYQRKNIIWNDVVENRKKIIKELPDSNFNIIPTVGILNVYNILHFHKEWVELELLDINRIDINLLSEPKGYNIQDLPEYHKERILKLYNEHIEWIKTYNNSEKAINEFNKVINYIKKEGSFKNLSYFLEFNKKLDSIRNENFFQVFPEYSDLEWYIKYTKLVETVGEVPLETIGALNEKLNKQYEYIRELEILRDNLNKKIAEKDSFISKTLHESNYVIELEEVRDTLNKKIAEKDSFINKTLMESNYVTELSNIKKILDSINENSIKDLNSFFEDIEIISNRLNSKIKKVSKENGYKSIL